jgi:hypothetical protein
LAWIGNDTEQRDFKTKFTTDSPQAVVMWRKVTDMDSLNESGAAQSLKKVMEPLKKLETALTKFPFSKAVHPEWSQVLTDNFTFVNDGPNELFNPDAKCKFATEGILPATQKTLYQLLAGKTFRKIGVKNTGLDQAVADAEIFCTEMAQKDRYCMCFRKTASPADETKHWELIKVDTDAVRLLRTDDADAPANAKKARAEGFTPNFAHEQVPIGTFVTFVNDATVSDARSVIGHANKALVYESDSCAIAPRHTVASAPMVVAAAYGTITIERSPGLFAAGTVGPTGDLICTERLCRPDILKSRWGHIGPSFKFAPATSDLTAGKTVAQYETMCAEGKTPISDWAAFHSYQNGFFAGWGSELFLVLFAVAGTMFHSWMGGMLAKALSSVWKNIATSLSTIVIWILATVITYNTEKRSTMDFGSIIIALIAVIVSTFCFVMAPKPPKKA